MRGPRGAAPAARAIIGAGPSATARSALAGAPGFLIRLGGVRVLRAQLAVPLALGHAGQVGAVGVARPVAACIWRSMRLSD